MTNGSSHGTDCFEVDSFLQRNENSKLFKVRNKLNGKFSTMEVVPRTKDVSAPTNPNLQPTPAQYLSKFLINIRYTFQTRSKFYYILDYIGDKTLEVLYKSRGCFHEADVKTYVSEIVIALEELHQSGLSYGELGLERVILDTNGHVVLWRNFCGKKYWSRKECVCSLPGMTRGDVCGNEHRVSTREKINEDWRSLATLIHRMLTGQDLTIKSEHDKKMEAKYVMQSLALPSTLSASVQDLIKRLSCGLINTSEQVKTHPFFRSTNWTQFRSRDNLPTSMQSDVYSKPRTRSSSPQAPSDISHHPSPRSTKENNELTQQNGYKNRSYDRSTRNTTPSRVTRNVNLPASQSDFPDYKYKAENIVKSSSSFGQQLYASSSTPDVSESGIEQGSPESFYTTLPQAGDLSYRHFDYSIRHDKQIDPEAVRFKYGVPERPDICQDGVSADYQRTSGARVGEWNTNPPYMPRQRCASMTELNRDEGFLPDRRSQPTGWERPRSPNYATFSYNSYESAFPKEPSNLRSSLSSSVPNLSELVYAESRDQSYRDLVSARFRENSNGRLPVHRNQETCGPTIPRGGNYHDHYFGCSCHDCKMFRNWQQSVTLNYRPTVRHSASSSFYDYAPNSFSSSFDKLRTVSSSRFESKDNSNQRYSFQGPSQENLYRNGGFGADLEGSRSRSSSVLSQSCTDIDQLGRDDERVGTTPELYHDRRKPFVDVNDPREKYPLAKMPIPSFEEFKLFRRQSTPDVTAATTSCNGTAQDRSAGFYQRNFENTVSTTSSSSFDPQLSHLTSGGNGDSQYSSIYQRIQDVAGRNTNAFENSSLFAKDTSSSKLEQQRPSLRKDSRSSPALVRSSPVYSFTSPTETTLSNNSQSSEVEFSYFSRNEVIHKLMVKYGLYGRSSKTTETSSTQETRISESAQQEDHNSILRDSSILNGRPFSGETKLGNDKELYSNGMEKLPQGNDLKRCGDVILRVPDAIVTDVKKKDVCLQRNVTGKEERGSDAPSKFTSQDKGCAVSIPSTLRVGEKGATNGSSVLTTVSSAQTYEEQFLYDADNLGSNTTGIRIEQNNKTVVDNNNNANNYRQDFDFLSERRRSSVRDLYSSFKRSSSIGETKHTANKDSQGNEKVVERPSPGSDGNAFGQRILQDSDVFVGNARTINPGAPNGLDTPENTSELRKPSLYKASRTFLFASKFKLGLSKKLKQNKKVDQTKKSGKSPTISKRSETIGGNQELRRSISNRSLTSIGLGRTSHPMLGTQISSISQSELATGENSSLFTDSNRTGMSKKSYHSSMLSIASTYSACSTDTEDNISMFSESDLMPQEHIRERGNRNSRWDSFHSNISADSGSAHMFEYETDSVATELDDEVEKKKPAVETQRKSEADIERADSGYGGDISAVRTPPKVKRRLEEIVEGSSKYWSVVATSAKHWQELAKQRSNQRKGSPLRKRAPSVTDDMVQCPDCLKHYVPEDERNSSKQKNENASKSDLICSKCRARHVERKEVIIELVQTEMNYGTDLLVLKEEFYIPMQSGSILNPEHLAAIFLNLQELLEVNSKFGARLQKGLEESVAKGDEEFAELNVGKAFLESVEFFQAYEIYCSKQNAAAALLESLQKKNELLKIFLNVTCRENQKCRKMDLNSFLLAPVQRIMKYPLLLSRIRRATPRWNTDREKLKLAQRKIEEQLNRINSLNTTVESKQRKYRGSGLLGRSDSLDKLQMKKMASEILSWSIGEIQLLMYGIFQVAIFEFVSSSWNRRGNKKALDVCVLFCIRGHNEPIKVDSDDEGECEAELQPLFPGEGDITDACLVLLKKKLNGKYTLFKDPLSLDSCVVCRDSEHKDTFEIICMSQETYLFKANTSRECRRWLKFLRLSAKDLGNWKRRRNGLPNIMIKNL